MFQVLTSVFWKHFRSPPPLFGVENFQVPPQITHPPPLVIYERSLITHSKMKEYGNPDGVARATWENTSLCPYFTFLHFFFTLISLFMPTWNSLQLISLLLCIPKMFFKTRQILELTLYTINTFCWFISWNSLEILSKFRYRPRLHASTVIFLFWEGS